MNDTKGNTEPNRNGGKSKNATTFFYLVKYYNAHVENHSSN